MSRRFRYVLSGACALLAVAVCLAYSQRVRAEAEQVRADAIARYGGEVVSLVVSTGPLEPGDVVGTGNAAARDWLADLAPEGAVTSMDDVVGRQVTVACAAGCPLTELNFRDASKMAEVPEGHVALSIAVTDKLGLAQAVDAGARLAAYEVGADGAALVTDDVLVLAAPDGRQGGLSGSSVTVAVASADVSGVLAASAAGTLRLVVPAEGSEVGEETGQSAPAQVPTEPVSQESPSGEKDVSVGGEVQ